MLPLIKSINEAKIQQSVELDNLTFATNLLLKQNSLNKSQLISQDKLDDLVDKVEDLGKKNQVEVVINNTNRTLNDLDKKDVTLYAGKVLNINVSGAFKNLGSFLMDVRDMPDAILDINNVKLSRNPKDASVVQARINFVVFAAKNDEQK